MSHPPTQLSLPVHLPDDETFASYHPDGNQLLVDSLNSAAAGKGERITYLWGPAKSGRTHLLHATCALAGELGKSAFYLPLGILPSISPAILEGLEHLDLVCLDEVEHISRHPAWEEALFDLYNRIQEQQRCRIVVSANAAAANVGFLLPDLVSRLSWGVQYQVQPLSDDAKLSALQARAKSRGLELPDDVGRFLLARLARDLRTLFDILDKLDKASLVAQRRLTIPFVKQTLHL